MLDLFVGKPSDALLLNFQHFTLLTCQSIFYPAAADTHLHHTNRTLPQTCLNTLLLPGKLA